MVLTSPDSRIHRMKQLVTMEANQQSGNPLVIIWWLVTECCHQKQWVFLCNYHIFRYLISNIIKASRSRLPVCVPVIVYSLTVTMQIHSSKSTVILKPRVFVVALRPMISYREYPESLQYRDFACCLQILHIDMQMYICRDRKVSDYIIKFEKQVKNSFLSYKVFLLWVSH